MPGSTTSLLSIIHNELEQIGYTHGLLVQDYAFDDAANPGSKELCVALAAFAQSPPSYRNACIGVLEGNRSSGAQHVAEYGTLGAPMFFELFDDHLDRYCVVSPSKAVFLESIPRRYIKKAFEENRQAWAPDSIFRAKAITASQGLVQLDFVDLGLLPALKGMIHDKLDRLLKRIFHEAIHAYKRAVPKGTLDEAKLFRLAFRFLAAKIFKDKGHPGNWASSDVNTVLRQVQGFYGAISHEKSPILTDPDTQQVIWDRFRTAFNFQNLAVDDLAFIYENTLVRDEARKQYGIHSTPSAVAELIVDRLPFEDVPQDERFVLEPCAGHGVFLVAALRRLRELLPSSWTDSQRHVYLQERLKAIEIDPFAAEVCRLSLMLADYPNPDGWQIISRDIFATDVLTEALPRTNVVLCNPPFEDFSERERMHYGNRIQSTHKPYEVLRRVLENPPRMLGFILPKSAIMGGRYSDLQERIAGHYTYIETVALPDRVFVFSDQETMLVLASHPNPSEDAKVFTKTFWIREKERKPFLEAGMLPEAVGRATERDVIQKGHNLWNPPLWEIWDYLKDYPRLKDIAEAHRGIEWNISLKDDRETLVSCNPKTGFKRGLETVRYKLEAFYTKDPVFLNIEERFRRNMAHFLPWGNPKVIVNSRRISRGPWRIAAAPDSIGLVCSESFIALWPQDNITIEVLAALINSPVINAALYAQGYGRHNFINVLQEIAVPSAERLDTQRISLLVREYAQLRASFGTDLSQKPDVRRCVKLLQEIDSLVLKAYDLPPRLERKLLEFFRGYPRPISFPFPDYFPENFHPCIPLHKYLAMNMRQASAGELLKRISPIDDDEVHELVLNLERD